MQPGKLLKPVSLARPFSVTILLLWKLKARCGMKWLWIESHFNTKLSRYTWISNTSSIYGMTISFFFIWMNQKISISSFKNYLGHIDLIGEKLRTQMIPPGILEMVLSDREIGFITEVVGMWKKSRKDKNFLKTHYISYLGTAAQTKLINPYLIFQYQMLELNCNIKKPSRRRQIVQKTSRFICVEDSLPRHGTPLILFVYVIFTEDSMQIIHIVG